MLSSQNNGIITPWRAPEVSPTTAPSVLTPSSGKLLPIPLGTISESTPSVSHLLINHPELRPQCWEIIFSPINQEKQFTSMPPGLEVFFDPVSKELTWQQGSSPAKADKEVAAPATVAETNDAGSIHLGTISSEEPTVSHLLRKHQDYSNKTWEIIFSATNRLKPYAELHPGAIVSINPQTLELSLKQEEVPNIAMTPHPCPPKSESALTLTDPQTSESAGFAKKFADSVKSYLGRPYQAIDCYGLVIRGLQDLGVHYGGNGGLRQQLVDMAAQKGLPDNAYHNGEGLIEIAGNKLFDESFSFISNAEQQAHTVMNKIKPLLQEGMLLSFSTPSRGHTGVISQKNGEWTYVNSGVIDHQVDGGKAAKRVGEETLTAEITNWFKLAQNKKTSLKVSAGIFDTEKLKDKARLAMSKSPGPGDVI